MNSRNTFLNSIVFVTGHLRPATRFPLKTSFHADCHSRIQYKRTCLGHGELPNDQIVSGYQYAKDHYVVVDPDELDRLRTEADKAIQIDVFIASWAFDPLYGTGKRSSTIAR